MRIDFPEFRDVTRGRTARLALAGVALAAVHGVASPLAAQMVDPRWQPWLGCWAPLVSAVDDPTPARSASQQLCITPAATGSGVDIANVVDGKREPAERLAVTGTRVSKTRDGCDGWEIATWGVDARRIMLRSEFTCAGGAVRKSSGIFAFTSTGEFLQVHGVSVGGNVAVRAARFLETDDVATDMARRAVGVNPVGGFSAATARMAATSEVTADDVADVAKQVDPQVTEAWLAQLGQGFRLDASQLMRMADAGVQPRVIDLMIALSNPKTFAIQRAGQIDRTVQETQDNRRGFGGFGNAAYMPIGFGSWQMGAWGMSPNDFYGMGMYGNQFGAFGLNNQWGSPFFGNGVWGNPFVGNNPIVIVNRGDTPPPGRAVNGAGYTRGGGRTGSPAGRSDSYNPSGSMGRSSPMGGSAGGSSTGGASSGGGDAGGGGRTAKPRGSGN